LTYNILFSFLYPHPFPLSLFLLSLSLLVILAATVTIMVTVVQRWLVIYRDSKEQRESKIEVGGVRKQMDVPFINAKNDKCAKSLSEGPTNSL
jgi:hypothetical protein